MEFENETLSASVEVKEEENVVLGILGALVGAVLGGASIILLSQLGYVASISGVILAFCTLKGYELLAKGLSTKGIVICVILMLVTPFAADLLDWGIAVYSQLGDYGYSFTECMLMLPEFFADGTITMGEYLKNLGMIYLFVAIGGFYILKGAIQKK